MKVRDIVTKTNKIESAKRYIENWMDNRGENLCARDTDVLDEVDDYLSDLINILLDKEVK